MPLKYRVSLFLGFLLFIAILAGSLFTPLTKKEPLTTFSMDDFKNPLPEHQGIYHVFASWCLKCKLDQNKFKDLAIKPIGILFDPEDIANIDQFKQIYSHILIPKGNKTLFKLKITGIPETLLVDRQGLIAQHFKGELSLSEVKALLK